jgi:hypothetical protein
MSARRNIAQRTTPPNQQQQQQNNVRSAMNGPRFVADGQQQQEGAVDIKKMHPMAVLSLHEERLNEIDGKMAQFQTQLSQNQTKRSTGDESTMIAECIKQIKFLTQENQTNRNLARELTLELLRLKTSLQEDGKIETHVSEESQNKYEAFKEKANNINASQSASQNVRDELMSSDNGASTLSFSGNGAYDPNAL